MDAAVPVTAGTAGVSRVGMRVPVTVVTRKVAEAVPRMQVEKAVMIVEARIPTPVVRPGRSSKGQTQLPGGITVVVQVAEVGTTAAVPVHRPSMVAVGVPEVAGAPLIYQTR